MDVANAIIDLATDKYKQECWSNACTIEVTFHGGAYSFAIKVVPMQHHVLVSYGDNDDNGLTFRVPRASKTDMEENSVLLADDILEKCRTSLDQDLENFMPFEPEEQDNNWITVTCKDKQVLRTKFNEENLAGKLTRYMGQLRLLC